MISEEIGTVTIKDDIQGKLKNRGKACVFIGYSVDHVNNVYQMLNLNTKRIIHSREVVWLGKGFKEWLNNNIVAKDQVIDDDYEDDIDYKMIMSQEEDEVEKVQVTQEKDQSFNRKLYRVMKQNKVALIHVRPRSLKIFNKEGASLWIKQILLC